MACPKSVLVFLTVKGSADQKDINIVKNLDRPLVILEQVSFDRNLAVVGSGNGDRDRTNDFNCVVIVGWF